MNVEKRADPATPEACLPSHLRKPRLRRVEAVEYLQLVHGITIAVSTLAKKATLGGGPGYQKLNSSPLYPRAELDRWACEQLGRIIYSSSEVRR